MHLKRLRLPLANARTQVAFPGHWMPNWLPGRLTHYSSGAISFFWSAFLAPCSAGHLSAVSSVLMRVWDSGYVFGVETA